MKYCPLIEKEITQCLDCNICRENDIRTAAGLWCDDITFCQEKCGWKSCPRNKENIHDRTIPHSYFVGTPPDCPKQKEDNEIEKWSKNVDEFSFSEWLENELKTRDIKVADLANMTGLTKASIWNYVKCRRFPSIVIVNDILNALGKKIIIIGK